MQISSEHYNMSGGALFRTDIPSPSLGDLPSGPVELDAIQWHLPAARAPALEDWKLKRALNKRKAVLPPEAPTVFGYMVHYADGGTETVPVRYNREIGPWKAWGHARRPSNAEVAWRLHVGGEALLDQQPARRFLMLWRPQRRWVRAPGEVALYSTRWENPHPDSHITTIDLVSANTRDQDWGAGALFAISTAERIQ